MAEIEKLMNVAIGDIEKIMNIATGDIEKVMGHAIPSAGWTGTRGILSGGNTSGAGGPWIATTGTVDIHYKTISSTGAMSDFGDLSGNNTSHSSTSNGSRGLIMGGITGTTDYNKIEYITIGSTGDVTDAGDLTEAKYTHVPSSNGTIALIWGGNNASDAKLDVIEYITINSTSDATDFGDISTGAVAYQGGSVNDATYALRYHGATGASFWGNKYIDYVTMASTGDSSDFGDMLADAAKGMGGCESETRGVMWGHMSSGATTNVIEYVTTASAGDSTDFGDMDTKTHNDQTGGNAVSNLTKGEVYGGILDASPYYAVARVEYITIASTGNATNAGDDLINNRGFISSMSGT